MYSKASFPLPPRKTRSNAIASQSKLNLSYTTVVAEENNDNKKVDYSDQLSDLRNKLAAAENIISEQVKKIDELKKNINDKDIKITVLSSNLSSYLNKSAVVLCHNEVQTDDVEFEIVKLMKDVSIQTDSKNFINNCAQTDTKFLHDFCIQVQLPDANDSVAQIYKDVSVQTKSKMSVNTFTQTITDVDISTQVESAEDVIENSKKSASLTTNSKNVSCSTSSVNANCSRDLPLKSTWSPTVNPKILIIGDLIARDLSSFLQKSLPKRFQVISDVKPGGSFEYVTKDLKKQADQLTKSDFIILLFSSSIINEINYDERIKNKFSNMIHKLSNTNVLCSTIAFDYSGKIDNNYIFSVNEFIEKEIFKHEHIMCLYTNKILNRFDFIDRIGLLSSKAKNKICKVIKLYINDDYRDDRSSANCNNGISKKRKSKKKSKLTTAGGNADLCDPTSIKPSSHGEIVMTRDRRTKRQKNILSRLLEMLT